MSRLFGIPRLARTHKTDRACSVNPLLDELSKPGAVATPEGRTSAAWSLRIEIHFRHVVGDGFGVGLVQVGEYNDSEFVVHIA
jgi:hypothetical protein